MYHVDLAWIHHEGFGGFADGAAQGLLALFEKAGVRRGSVVDLGCGDGRWLRRLHDAGYEATGVDSSAALLEIARQTAPRANLVRASIEDYSLPPCEAVTALGEVLSYLPPGGNRRPSLPRLFGRVARSLPRGGLFVFDLLCEASAGATPLDSRSWRAGADWAVLSHAREEPSRRRLVREILTFRRIGQHYRRGHERHLLRISSRREVEAGLRSAGFSARSARRLGTHELLPRRFVFIARKR